MFDQGKVAFMPLPFAQFRTYTTYPYYVTEQTNFEKKQLKCPVKILHQLQQLDLV